jgi:hypothetical protein
MYIPTMNGTTTMMGSATITICLGASRYGTPRPQVEVRAPKGTSHRRLRAALFALAAELELATPAGERWIVQVDPFADDVGWVYLELMDGDDAEAARAMQLLRRIGRRAEERGT